MLAMVDQAFLLQARALTELEAGVLARAAKSAIADAWKLLYGVNADIGEPVVGELKRNHLPGAVLICRGSAPSSSDGHTHFLASEAWFRVEIISQPNPDDTD